MFLYTKGLCFVMLESSFLLPKDCLTAYKFVVGLPSNLVVMDTNLHRCVLLST